MWGNGICGEMVCKKCQGVCTTHHHHSCHLPGKMAPPAESSVQTGRADVLHGNLNRDADRIGNDPLLWDSYAQLSYTYIGIYPFEDT